MCSNCKPPDMLRPYGIGVGYANFIASTPAIPQLYWDVYSAEQRWKEICCNLKKLIEYADAVNVELGVTEDRVAKLEADFKKFMESGFFDYYAKQLEKWINDNMERIISKAIRMVFFGLTPDGYFCAYIPKSWRGIVFDTVANYADENYGCLILEY